jgi:hypothetical protein
MAKGAPPPPDTPQASFARLGPVGFVLIGAALVLYGLHVFKVIDERIGDDLLIIGGAGAAFLIIANIGPLIQSFKLSKDGWELNLNGALNADIQRLTAKIGELEIKVDECCGEKVAAATSSRTKRVAAVIAAPEVEPPYKSRPVVDPQDKNAGRFGGSDQASGFRLTVSFEGGGDWATINLAVVADATVGELLAGESVEFHLHETFPTPIMRRPLRNGTATLSVTVWGGFTVGVWIPSRAVELELNLATARGAPRIIREN